MNLLAVGLEPVLRLMRGRAVGTCFACGGVIRPSDERLRLRGDRLVHRRCATYRTRTRRSGSSRIGFPG
jgi:hypothetical protein